MIVCENADVDNAARTPLSIIYEHFFVKAAAKHSSFHLAFENHVQLQKCGGIK